VRVEVGEVGITSRRVIPARLPESFTASFAGLYASAVQAA
jgi:hypothetical protein